MPTQAQPPTTDEAVLKEVRWRYRICNYLFIPWSDVVDHRIYWRVSHPCAESRHRTDLGNDLSRRRRYLHRRLCHDAGNLPLPSM